MEAYGILAGVRIFTIPAPHSIETGSAPITTSISTSIPMGGGVSYTRSLRVGIATAPSSPWEGLVWVPSVIATTPSSPIATLLENTTVVGSIHILTWKRHLLVPETERLGGFV